MRWSVGGRASLTLAHAREFHPAPIVAIRRSLTTGSSPTMAGELLSQTRCLTIHTSMTKCSRIQTRLAKDTSTSRSPCNLQRAHPVSVQGWVRLELLSQELLSSMTGPIPMAKLPCPLRLEAWIPALVTLQEGVPITTMQISTARMPGQPLVLLIQTHAS